MSSSKLRDLVLAGVKWELSEIPTVIAKQSADKNEKTSVAPSVDSAACVVPPIAPTQMMSIDTVRSMAARPMDIDSLKRMIGEFNHPLRSTVANTVLPHVGNGKLLILTDIPGADDDMSGVLLSGASGELMDKMLSAIGLSRTEVSIVPMLFWRTPGGRTPTRDELDLSRPFVDKAIDLIKPSVILSLGTLPATEYGGVNLAKSHGVQIDMENGVRFIPIFHPNYLLLKPVAKRDVWTALQNVQNILKNLE